MIDDMLEALNKQKDKHYRMISLDPTNIAKKRYKGYEPVTSKTPRLSVPHWRSLGMRRDTSK